MENRVESVQSVQSGRSHEMPAQVCLLKVKESPGKEGKGPTLVEQARE